MKKDYTWEDDYDHILLYLQTGQYVDACSDNRK